MSVFTSFFCRTPWIKKTVIILLCISGYVVAACWWYGSSARQADRAMQADLQQQVDLALQKTRAGLESRIEELEASIGLFVSSNRAEINQLLADPTIGSGVYQRLLTLLKQAYPDVVAFTLADTSGKPILEPIKKLIGQPCEYAIQMYAADAQSDYRSLHPNQQLTHFDVMVSVDSAAGRVIFFANFLTPIITGTLQRFSSHGVEVMLLHRQNQQMIEFTEAGARGTYRRNWRLQPEEQSRIRGEVPITGSQWNLVAMPALELEAEKVQQLQHGLDSLFTRLLLVGLLLLVVVTLLVKLVFFRMAKADRTESNRDQPLHHDPLTGLPDRLLLMARIQLTLQHCQRDDGLAAVLFVDLDNFDQLNQQLGDAVGDRVLEQLAASLINFPQADTVARLADDQFALLLSDLADAKTAELIGQQLLQQIAAISELETLPLPLSASIGLVFYPRDGVDSATLLEHAEQAMLRVKTAGGNGVATYQPGSGGRGND
ncbi:diguanylate cyclase domain-containing protein [Pontibacter sp. JAM-7]|uniref:diguanylate cyclase domain-containing protein n=1 Tax=Pontibacter sp. JAM-7 TaxID=3366581 RepID=UPI003AF8DF64